MYKNKVVTFWEKNAISKEWNCIIMRKKIIICVNEIIKLWVKSQEFKKIKSYNFKKKVSCNFMRINLKIMRKK